MTLVRCDTNYYYGALFFGEKKIMAVALMFFVECEKMTLIECDTMGLIFWGPKARAFLALWLSRHEGSSKHGPTNVNQMISYYQYMHLEPRDHMAWKR